MANWQCARCRAQVAPGAPRCPECPSTEFIKPEAEAGMLKIARDGSVSDSADVQGPHDHPGYGQEMHGTEHPADGTMSPPLSNDDPQAEIAELREEVAELEAGEAAEGAAPARVHPRVAPRRTPPPGAAGG